MKRKIKYSPAQALRATPPWKGMEYARVLVILLFLFAAPAMATTVVKMDLASLVKTSDSIVEGTVTRVDVKWDAKQRMAFTETTLRIEDNLKGDRAQDLTIRHEGGQIGSMHIEVSGTPKFQSGEDVIVFLKRMNDGTFYVVGLDQGKYSVVGDTAVSNQSGLEVLEPTSGRVLTGATTKTSATRLKAQIRELVK